VGKFLDWERFFMRARYHARTEKMTMADDLTDRGPRDRTRISMTEAHEVRYWTKELGVSKERVASVFARVGNSRSAILVMKAAEDRM
jgi:uncharacterized protein DUF3606